ncbi:NUDIX domain-containing protein [Sporolactobacillus sp. CPB3-1]|uniref:NUDIX domain-containing protein n=1 Tax=Sporolactobacillus mangiferae TaxID=2940498 RepID=A0ABT0M9G7_9BACL|nr:NUDIX domain-containing protein [Sporolactobacillus mangiferae]MCL1631518.1 NUDIX domain-containing protein [Sporolactobacillus mangiferae]
MRDRGSVVIIENEKVALIERQKNDEHYFVFPGGGIKNDETPDQAAIREAFEELGVTVKIDRFIDDFFFSGRQYFFLADILNGQFGRGQGEEMTQSDPEKGTYHPVWAEISELTHLDVRPRQIAERVYSLGRG